MNAVATACPVCNCCDWRVMHGGKLRCKECGRRARRDREAKQRAAGVKPKTHGISKARLIREAARASRYTWQDYADACDREFSTPPYLRVAPKIKAWLIENKVRP